MSDKNKFKPGGSKVRTGKDRSMGTERGTDSGTTDDRKGGKVMDVYNHPARALPLTSMDPGSWEPKMNMDHRSGNLSSDYWKGSPDLHPYIGSSTNVNEME
jgi:hypothetical protein